MEYLGGKRQGGMKAKLKKAVYKGSLQKSVARDPPGPKCKWTR